MLDNPRWERFCQLYARDGNASAAYRAAGYNPRTDGAAWASASQLLRNPKVQARIEELVTEARARAEKEAIADIMEIRQRVTEVLRGRCPLDTKAADVIRAGEFLAKVGGMVPPDPPVRLELSLSDKGRRLQELLHGDD